MDKPSAKFQDWVDKLVKECLPLELQKKLLSLKPLTKTEAEKYISVVQLVAQARQLGSHEEILRQLENLGRGMRKSHENEREILSIVSDDPELYPHRDGRRLDKIKDEAVNKACAEIMKSPSGMETETAHKVYRGYKDEPEFYRDFDSFMRQVRRKLCRFRT